MKQQEIQELVSILKVKFPDARAGFIEVLIEALELHARKNHDYTGNKEFNPFDLGLKGRFHDLNRKFSRIYHIMWEEQEIKVDEKLEDTVIDLGNYCFLLAEELNNIKDKERFIE